MKKYRIKLFTFSSRHIENPTVKKVAGGQECFCMSINGKIEEYTDINKAHEEASLFTRSPSPSFDSAIVEEAP